MECRLSIPNQPLNTLGPEQPYVFSVQQAFVSAMFPCILLSSSDSSRERNVLIHAEGDSRSDVRDKENHRRSPDQKGV